MKLNAEEVQAVDNDTRGARSRRGATSGLLDVVRAYPGNADAWEALWLADEVIGAAGEPELVELNEAKL